MRKKDGLRWFVKGIHNLPSVYRWLLVAEVVMGAVIVVVSLWVLLN